MPYVHIQSCLTLCDTMDWSPPGSSVHCIFQVRILEWVAISSSRGFSQPRDQTHGSCVSALAGRFFATEPSQIITKLGWEEISILQRKWEARRRTEQKLKVKWFSRMCQANASWKKPQSSQLLKFSPHAKNAVQPFFYTVGLQHCDNLSL